MSALGDVVPQTLAEAVVLYPHGARKRMRDFWSERRCLFVFLRHFSCPGCSEQISLLSPHLPELRDARVRIVLVATSTPARIPEFAKRMHLENSGIDVVTDPTLVVHKSAGLVRGVWSTFGPQSLRSTIRLYREGGHSVPRDPEDGDVLQQGGALLVDTNAEVLFHHANAHMTDHMPMNVVCEVAFRRAS